MQAYIVGGAVRDALLGLPVKDRDWVVVGSTPEALLALGFRQVGKDFPVFLHPHSGEEYALARTERKHGRGYGGFVCHTSPEVTLEEDLARRDLTINAIARAEDGSLIDPYGGIADLQAGRFRHVSPAFAEDPLRILRVARFAARLPGFSVVPETLALMRHMVEQGEVDHLVAERVWQELARGLMESRPSLMFRCLRACGALTHLLPELERLFGVPQPARHHPEIDAGEHVLQVIDRAAAAGLPLAARWACLLHDLGKADTPHALLPHHYGHEARSAEHARAVSERLRAPIDCRDLAVMLAREHGILRQADSLRPETMVKLMERCDALRRPERFLLMLQAAAADFQGREPAQDLPAQDPTVADWEPAQRWRRAVAALRAVDAGAIARSCASPAQIPAAVHAARVAAVRALARPPAPPVG